jgi:hypothetical protein
MDRTLRIFRKTFQVLGFILRLLASKLSIDLDFLVIILSFLGKSCDSMVILAEAARSILNALLHVVDLLATISRLLLHSRESKWVCTGNIANRTSSVLISFHPNVVT